MKLLPMFGFSILSNVNMIMHVTILQQLILRWGEILPNDLNLKGPEAPQTIQSLDFCYNPYIDMLKFRILIQYNA